ncbi:MAG: hypothetical protein ACYC27_18745 [Armatimonadota bacterium]
MSIKLNSNGSVMLTPGGSIAIECCCKCYCRTTSGDTFSVDFSFTSGCPVIPTTQGTYSIVSGSVADQVVFDIYSISSGFTSCYYASTSGQADGAYATLDYAYGTSAIGLAQHKWRLRAFARYLYTNPYGSPKYKYYIITVFDSGHVDWSDFSCGGSTVFTNTGVTFASTACSGSTAVVSYHSL